MSRAKLRALWLRIHRWVALSVGVLLASVCVLGSTLIIARPLDELAHPELFRATAAADVAAVENPLAAVRGQLREKFGPNAALTFRPPREPGESLRVLVRGDWQGTVYLDPRTGVEQGRRGETEGVVNLLFEIHSSLLIEERGKAILGIAALSYLILLVTGLVLWWPRSWSQGWRVQLNLGITRSLFDLHRAIGASLGVLAFVSIASGAWMAWRPLGAALNTLIGSETVVAPSLPTLDREIGAAERPPLDQLALRAQAMFPHSMIGYVLVPARPDGVVRVRLRLTDDPHPNGLTSVWIDPRTGTPIRVDRWNELDVAGRSNAFLYPLHTGELGGVALESVNALNGLGLGALGVTGVWLWWRRSRRPVLTRS